MTNCKRCNQQMTVDTNFCPSCGQDQRTNNINQGKGSSSFLITLCVLTIIGSVFTIGRAYLYEMVAMVDEEHGTYYRGWIYAGSAIGTLIGAVMMIQRKLSGLYIYSVFQVIYIITVIVASFSYGETFDGADSIASGIAMFFIIPSITFLILYWIDMNRKHLS